MKNNCSSIKMSEELTRRGYADGSYMCICKTCGGIFQGDKRAWTCKGCATSADRIEQLEAQRDAAYAKGYEAAEQELPAYQNAAYKRGLEEAANIAEIAPFKRNAMICGCSEGLANYIAAEIRAQIQEGDDG